MSALNELRQLKGVKQEGTDNKSAFFFLLPWLIGLVVITIGPMIASLYLSFTDYNLLAAPDWIGIKNYQRMMSDPRLLNSVRVTRQAAKREQSQWTCCWSLSPAGVFQKDRPRSSKPISSCEDPRASCRVAHRAIQRTVLHLSPTTPRLLRQARGGDGT